MVWPSSYIGLSCSTGLPAPGRHLLDTSCRHAPLAPAGVSATGHGNGRGWLSSLWLHHKTRSPGEKGWVAWVPPLTSRVSSSSLVHFAFTLTPQSACSTHRMLNRARFVDVLNSEAQLRGSGKLDSIWPLFYMAASCTVSPWLFKLRHKSQKPMLGVQRTVRHVNRDRCFVTHAGGTGV